ncbi:protein SCAI [Trichonephila clavipes]|nr:protein SCAI [Trichonephila clavipes]
MFLNLRTSETNYLNETFSFYAAIRARGYYSKASKEERSDLMVKKLRYYARFIVVCLLLKKMKLVKELVRRLANVFGVSDDRLPIFKPTTFLDHLRYASAKLDLVLPICKHNSLLVELKSAVLAIIHERYPDQDWLHIFTDGSATAFFGRAGSGAFSNSFNHKELLSACATSALYWTARRLMSERTLAGELAKQIDDYTSTYEPEDQLEWSLVLGEIKSFIEADNLVNITDVNSAPVVLSHRLNPLNSPPVEKLPTNHLTLQEILIMGNCCDQVKFSELTLDMFRMLQTVEREPQEEATQLFDSTPTPGRIPFPPDNGDQRPAKRENPHKYLLYKPNISQLIVFLSSGFKELPPNGVLLLYMSADGCFTNVKHPDDGYDYGGIATNSKREPDHISKRNVQLKDIHCLYPGDLYPLTRKPLFVIVDSDNSHAFQYIPRYFGQPVLVLMSPEDIPQSFHDQQHKGNLFTLFLHSPLTAVCFICNITEIPHTLWEKSQSHVDRFMSEASRLLNNNFSPRSHPPLSEPEILEQPSLKKVILELVSLLDVRNMFSEAEETD